MPYVERSFKYCFTRNIHSFKNLLEKYDLNLFKPMQYSNSCLNHLLPLAKSSTRIKGHPYVLPIFHTANFRKSFLLRCLQRYE